ncbi:sushi, von Willebrand factor type A, EGF and pentraxin domain-containing protein 1-like isoform X1 [Rhopilema esculentum]|uniref:sushi, von Willebrand factor type A, EGF and pentraxin domain-containing protein 1-like isoform X1 n=1 Tax=Rhopilema esculentum TaxID=499914 RepID=UPI0031DC7BF2
MDPKRVWATIRCLFYCSINIAVVLACGGGGSRECTYQVCSASYHPWSPWPSNGQCVYQYARVIHSYRTIKQSSGCPGNRGCTERDQARVYCSCKVIDQCRWGGWGPFQGSISKGSCGTQRRYRYAQKTYTYVARVGSCSGTVTTCPRESDSQTRTWCNCRKAARCEPSNWSAWAGNVPDGQCGTQTSYRDFTPTYQYIEQQTNCYGIQSSCESRRTNSRTFCMCPYLHCTLEDWSNWVLVANSGTCPNEQRVRKHKGTTLFKGAHNDCIGIGPTSCPNENKETRKKPTTCPAIVVPAHGTLQEPACDGASSYCGATCSVSCNRNYPLEGPAYATCLTTGQWSNSIGACKDSIKPQITCPVIPAHPNKPNENYAEIDLPDAVASDNSGHVTVTIDTKSPLKVTVGTPVTVKYTAADAAGNTRECTVKIQAKDTEPPKVEFCPKDLIVSTERIPHTVIWSRPVFSDNVDPANAISIIPSHQNGQKFGEGTFLIKYIAHDRALNEATCEFNVQVSRMKCPVYEPPKHGASTCNIKKMGVKEVFVCSIACKSNFWFLQGEGIPTQYDFYICTADGAWKGQNQLDVTNPQMFVPIPSGKSPWPDCSKGDPPSEAKKPFKLVGGSCSQVDITKLKSEVVSALISDPVIASLYCTRQAQHCSLENVEVSCSSVRKRSTGAISNQVHITFDFYVKDAAPSTDQNTEMLKMTQIIATMGSLGKEVKRVYASKVQTSVANIIMEEKAPELACEAGSTFSVVNGTGTAKERSKCVKCPAGTTFNADSRTCTVCPVGTYQDNEGQLTCKQCKQGFSTHGYKSSNYTQCKEICRPGTYSADGLATCIACPKGTYQPSSNSTSCIPCPQGKGTDKKGSVVQTSCVTRAIQVEIKSEGCNDPTVAPGTCGIVTIKVDGVDYSQKRRGYNLVVVNGNTGAIEKSVSFDTHGNWNARVDLKNLVDNLSNGKIVLVGIQDEATARSNQYYVYSSLERLGGVAGSFQMQYRGSFAMVGYKGTSKPAWVRQVTPAAGRGPAILEATIPLV